MSSRQLEQLQEEWEAFASTPTGKYRLRQAREKQHRADLKTLRDYNKMAERIAWYNISDEPDESDLDIYQEQKELFTSKITEEML